MTAEPQEPPTGPSCFLDQFRVCGPDCVAYDLQGESPGKVHAPTHCTLLIGVSGLLRTARKIEVLLSTSGAK